MQRQLGSPPRMRGKLWMSIAALIVYGITPAHAGKTDRITSEWSEREDHPRACGENLGQLRLDTSILGSPPRMRGKLRCRSRSGHGGRITPAHAGKTKTRHCMCMRTGDHPRACGENDRQGRRDCHRSGSPPRMRGKLSKAKNCFTPPRITPAHAGKTAWLAEFVTIAEDHPRACGENFTL